MLDDLPIWCPEFARPDPGARLAVIGFPFAGGSAAAWMGWETALGADVAFMPYELPGHGMRFGEPAMRDRAALVARIAADLQMLDGVQPVLMGHSMGATLAFEVALALGGEVPVVVSARAPPDTPPPGRPDLSDAGLIELLRSRGGTPTEVLDTPELLELILPILRADYQLLLDQPALGGPLAAPMLVLGGHDDVVVPASALEGWRTHSSEMVDLRLFAGDHFFVQQAAPVQAALRSWLARL